MATGRASSGRAAGGAHIAPGRLAYLDSSAYAATYAREARAWLEGISLLPMDDPVLDAATSLGPPTLRSLDALHLATALSVRDDLGAFFTHDSRLAQAAEAHDLPLAGLP